MAASIAMKRSAGPRLLSQVFAAIISLAVLGSLLHCCFCFDCDEGTLTVSVAQTSPGEPGKTAPCSTTAHCCHCLAHATVMAPQDTIVSFAYVTRLDRAATAPAPDATDLESPFKPPRA